MCEITIVLIQGEKRYTERFDCHEIATTAIDDPVIDGYISEALKNLVGQPDEIQVKIRFNK